MPHDSPAADLPVLHDSKPSRYRLFQRDDCHLCDLALAVLAQARFPAFDSVFIDGDEALEAAYGERVPVLRDGVDDRELGWPFGADALVAWLAASPPVARSGD